MLVVAVVVVVVMAMAVEGRAGWRKLGLGRQPKLHGMEIKIPDPIE